MRDLLDGLFYLVRAGCQSRRLPPRSACPRERRGALFLAAIGLSCVLACSASVPAGAQSGQGPSAARGGQSAALPSLVLPPAATAEPLAFTVVMWMGDSAMVRGDIMTARSFYEQAVAMQPRASAALIAAGKSYDPNILRLFGTGTDMADTAKARERYERARVLGAPNAAALLGSLR